MHMLNVLWAAHNEEAWLRRRFRCILRERVEDIPDREFERRYRLDKNTFRQLCFDLLNLVRGSRDICLETKVLCALSFYATGSYQTIVGSSHYLTQRAVSRCVSEVTDALTSNGITSRWIVFPQNDEKRNEIKLKFQRRFGLPGVIGCIDCTHVGIVQPNEDEHLYFNRKGYHSLNVQMVCDTDLRILNVNTKFGGATHDSFIWQSSKVEPFMRQLHQDGEQVWLLGDSGYPQRSWLMTPVINAVPGSREELYTQRHVRARNCVERCFGVLKARWRCLLKDRILHYHPHMARKITMACCVLHNMTLHLPPPEVVPIDEDGDADMGVLANIPNVVNQNDLMAGRATRGSLIDRLH